MADARDLATDRSACTSGHNIKIEIAPDGLTATAFVEIIPGYYNLKDLEPIFDFIPEKLIEDSALVIDPSDIIIALRSYGIFVGIDTGAVAALAANPEGHLV